MKIIEGLILKDLLQLKSYVRTMFFYIVIFFITSFSYASEDKSINPTLLILITLAFGMFAIVSFSYDTTSKADRYVLTLPTTKKEIVASKYWLTILATFVGTLIGIIINLIVSCTLNNAIPNLYELIIIALSGTFGIALVHSIQLPCIYKFGIEKGRIISTLIAMIIASFIANVLIFNINENVISGTLEKLLPFIFLGLISIFYYVSYKISCLIYERKEV